jgi:hypothetical protein
MFHIAHFQDLSPLTIIIIAWNPGPKMALELRILCYVHLEWRRLTWEAYSTVEARTKVRSSRQNHKKASDMVQTDPAIMGGTPIMEILEGYPSLTRKMVEYAHIYAATHPRPGPPPTQPWSGTKPRK